MNLDYDFSDPPGIPHGSAEDADFAATVSNDISEGIDNGETREQLRRVISWWASESSNNHAKFVGMRDRYLRRYAIEVLKA